MNKMNKVNNQMNKRNSSSSRSTTAGVATVPSHLHWDQRSIHSCKGLSNLSASQRVTCHIVKSLEVAIKKLFEQDAMYTYISYVFTYINVVYIMFCIIARKASCRKCVAVLFHGSWISPCLASFKASFWLLPSNAEQPAGQVARKNHGWACVWTGCFLCCPKLSSKGPRYSCEGRNSGTGRISRPGFTSVLF